MIEKEKLRKKLIEARKNLPRRQADYSALLKSPYFKNASVVFCYVSYGSEIDTLSLIKHILKEKTLCVPYCTDKSGNMIAVKINSTDDLLPGSFGILEPKNPLEFDKSLIDVCIVPGLGFDKQGGRIGYGKGYYDRFLAGLNSYTIGMCHRELLLDSIPSGPNDIKVKKQSHFKCDCFYLMLHEVPSQSGRGSL